MAGISSPAAFKRVNSVTFFSGHTVEQGCPFFLAANVVLQRVQHYVQKMLTQHHSVNNTDICQRYQLCCLLFVYCHVMGHFIKLQQLNIMLKKKYF